MLFSGGLDSAVLVALAAREGPVQPLYVSVGLAWEATEREVAARFLASLPAADVRPMASLRVDMTDVYPPTHWAIRGEAPGFDTPDEDVYLEGPERHPAVEGRRVHGPRAHRAGVDRAARRQPVSRRHAPSSSPPSPRAVDRRRRADRGRSRRSPRCTRPT